jgi:hypothetical protein
LATVEDVRKYLSSGMIESVPGMTLSATISRFILLSAIPLAAFAEANISWALSRIQGTVAKSFPELRGADVQIREFRSDSDYFRTRFGIPQFVFGRQMRYLIFVNPRAVDAGVPKEAVDAILAHELEHIVWFQNRKRIRLLELVRLSSSTYTIRFERDTDLRTIRRGYASGLREYRIWLYRNIPAGKVARKKRTYLTPEEITAIQASSPQ